MQCDGLREAISARIDGEDPGLPDGALYVHLGFCAGCRAWQQRAHAVTRRARLGGLFLDHDLAPKVIAAASAVANRRGRRFIQQAGPTAMAAVQLAVAIPCCCSGTIAPRIMRHCPTAAKMAQTRLARADEDKYEAGDYRVTFSYGALSNAPGWEPAVWPAEVPWPGSQS